MEADISRRGVSIRLDSPMIFQVKPTASRMNNRTPAKTSRTAIWSPS